MKDVPGPVLYVSPHLKPSSNAAPASCFKHSESNRKSLPSQWNKASVNMVPRAGSQLPCRCWSVWHRRLTNCFIHLCRRGRRKEIGLQSLSSTPVINSSSGGWELAEYTGSGYNVPLCKLQRQVCYFTGSKIWDFSPGGPGSCAYHG